jgi:dephospho-CoA kinase
VLSGSEFSTSLNLEIMIVAGLTGNYGMGKSTVARLFRELGASTIDTDEIVRALLREEDVLAEIRGIFGSGVIRDGLVDRKALADEVFAHPHLRRALEDVLHGRVFSKVDERLAGLSSEGCQVAIVEAPVLFERGYQNRFDAIITVHAPEEVALRRLESKGVSTEEGRRRLGSQFPVDMKRLRSDWGVDNSGTVDETRRQVERVYQELLARGAGKSRHSRGSDHGGN